MAILNAHWLLVVFFSICIISCESHKKFSSVFQTDNNQYKIGEVEIRLDSLTSIESPSKVFYAEGDSLFLLITNSLGNSVDIYSCDSKKLYKRVVFDREGPNGINQIHSCIPINRDSIVVFGKFGINDTKLIDFNGQMLNNNFFRNFARPEEFKYVVNHGGDYIYIENKIYLSNIMFGSFNSYMQNVSNWKIELICDLKLDSIYALNIGYPEQYQKKHLNTYTTIPLKSVNENYLVYSWGALDSIHVRSLHDLTEDKSYYAAHPKWGLTLDDKEVFESTNQTEQVLNHCYFGRIIYSPSKNLYYRLALIPSSYYAKSRDNNWEIWHHNKIGLVVLDDDFSIISYHIFPPDKYDFFGITLGNKGLMFPRNNPFNPNIDEDILHYDVYSFAPDNY